MWYFRTVHIRAATNAHIGDYSPTPADIKLKWEVENPHIVQAGTGHIVLVDSKNRLINDEKINCLFFQPLWCRTSLCLLLTVISHEFPVCSLATLDHFPYWLWNYVIIQITSMMASQACPQIVYRCFLFRAWIYLWLWSIIKLQSIGLKRDFLFFFVVSPRNI